jgi:hypothetical protein
MQSDPHGKRYVESSGVGTKHAGLREFPPMLTVLALVASDEAEFCPGGHLWTSTDERSLLKGASQSA